VRQHGKIAGSSSSSSSLSVPTAAAENVLEKGISTDTSTHAHTRAVRERSHPHLPHRNARQHAPRARWHLGAAAPVPRRPAGQRLSLHLGGQGSAGGAHLALRGRAAPRAGALCPPSGSRRGPASRRPLRCRRRWRRRVQGGAAKRRRARSAICGSLCQLRRRPALQPCAGKYTWHRARQSRRSSERAARRSALRCATPLRQK